VDLEIMKLQLKEEAFYGMDVWVKTSTLWGSNIYQHCIDNGYEPEMNLTAEEGKKKLLHDSETLAMMLVTVYAGQLSGRKMSRRELSIALDKDNAKAKDTKIVRDLEKLKRFELLIHNEPSLTGGERGARFIEPTERLINFFNQYWKVAKQ
jgi:hypothetical protein